jgi:serine/threonine protein kinase
VILVDFGFAKYATHENRIIDNPPPANKKLAQSSKRGGLGTLGYMAPENATSPHL